MIPWYPRYLVSELVKNNLIRYTLEKNDEIKWKILMENNEYWHGKLYKK